jgi:IS5 family transposase
MSRIAAPNSASAMPNCGTLTSTATACCRALSFSWTTMRVENWNNRELRQRINDGLTLRTFTDFDSHRVPKYDFQSRLQSRTTA